MPFILGDKLESPRWFDFGEIDGKMVELQIRSSNWEPFRAAEQKAGHDYHNQFIDDSSVETHKPLHYFLMKAYALLIKDWKRIDILSIDENGKELLIENAPPTEKNKHDILYKSDSFIFWNFVKQKSDEIASEQDNRKFETLGK